MNVPPLSEIEKKLMAEISTILGIDPATVKPEVPLHTLGINSLSLVEILVFVEKSFALNLMESGLSQEDFQTTQSLAGRIAKELDK